MGVLFLINNMQSTNVLRVLNLQSVSRLSVIGGRSFCMNADFETNTFTTQHHQRLNQLIRGRRYEQAQSFFERVYQQGTQPPMTTQYIIHDCLIKQDKDSEESLILWLLDMLLTKNLMKQ